MRDLHPRQRHSHAGSVEQHAHAHHRQHAKALDQVPGEEARREHADDVPLQHERRVGEVVAAHLHGQRRGRHQQVHHTVAQGGAQRGDEKRRLAQQHPQWAALGCRATRRLHHGRKAHERHQQHGQQPHQHQRHVGPGERRGQQVARVVGQVGPGHGAQQPTGQHQRHSFLAEGRGRQLGRREAVQLPVGAVVAGHHRGGAQQPELVRERGPGAQQGRAHGHCQPDLERHAPPPAPLRTGHQSGRQRTAHHVAHDGQRGHPAIGGELQPDQSIDGDEDNVVGKEKPLAQGQQPEVLVHGVLCCINSEQLARALCRSVDPGQRCGRNPAVRCGPMHGA